MASVNKLFTAAFMLWFSVAQALFGVSAAYAQSASPRIDVEPPLIEHDVISDAEADFRQTIVASVVDDDELDTVSLYYRFEGEPTYSSILMKRVSFSSTYIAHVPTDPASDNGLEYYIQARDKSGNRTVRGYAFNPLVRSISAPDPMAVNGATSRSASPPESASSKGGGRTLLYVVLGVLAVGALASAASGGGGDSTPPGTECVNGRCGINITIGQP